MSQIKRPVLSSSGLLRLLSGRQRPASVLAGLGPAGRAARLHVGGGEVALPPREPAGVCGGPLFPAR